MFVQIDFLNEFLSGQRLCGMRSIGSKNMGASIMLQVVFMKFSMINNVMGLLVGDSK